MPYNAPACPQTIDNAGLPPTVLEFRLKTCSFQSGFSAEALDCSAPDASDEGGGGLSLKMVPHPRFPPEKVTP